MSIGNNDMKHLLNGRKYAPVREFAAKPSGAILIEADCGRFQVYTIEEHKAAVLDELITKINYTTIAVDPKRSNS